MAFNLKSWCIRIFSFFSFLVQWNILLYVNYILIAFISIISNWDNLLTLIQRPETPKNAIIHESRILSYNARYILPDGKLDHVDPSKIVRRNSRYLK